MVIIAAQTKIQVCHADLKFMDRVFLQVLAAAPEQGPALFEMLFRNAPSDRLERFLSGSSNFIDRLSVMTSLPPIPFLRAAVFPT